ncbi:hypothetical protein G0Q06_14060 [Puniceicoccales bacterium CK1056]|uniref:Uncharacterized protein n=1 Tax=Oceanipulchritudo coccoides TaxID=2706888 RepID=A0A6B2M651_9BACT|nr:hypothetical protein [Oceanipulchritudo coccoides]NDV63584.1 hypothetical protein [Oceanipulchritudo coccoides]
MSRRFSAGHASTGPEGPTLGYENYPEEPPHGVGASAPVTPQPGRKARLMDTKIIPRSRHTESAL